MSLLTHEGRITVKAFAAVPTLVDLPEIQQQPPGSVSIAVNRGVELAEGCILTKSVKYTHELTHWVNDVCNGDPRIPSEVEHLIEFNLRIIPYRNFSLNDPCNLAYLEAFVHTSLEVYAFIALTASFSTLNNLIEMVKADNNRCQLKIDETGFIVPRKLNFSSSGFTNPEYELVAIHPEHFLPYGSVLPVFHSATSAPTLYVSARDRCLRESPEPDSPCLPTFHHVTENRSKYHCLNVFLVILNAEIKFHRYLCMINENPPSTPLPADTLTLMHLTMELVDLLYWKPVPTKGSQGEVVFNERMELHQRDLSGTRQSKPDIAKTIERGSSEKRKVVGDEEMDDLTRSQSNLRHKGKLGLPEDMDLETRKAYGRALMSGHDCDYDPALFEDAIPINKNTKPLTEKVNVEAWRQNIGSEM